MRWVRRGKNKKGKTGRTSLKRYAWLSIAAAVAMIGLKTGAYFRTGSVGLLSEAIESIIDPAGGGIGGKMPKVESRFRG
jgi:divalent metal cation (Fe/Co/Zn/Cd) transporter